MANVLSLKNRKKRDMAVAAVFAFLLSLSFYLFDNNGISAETQPVFLQLAVCCAVFYCALGLMFCLNQPWIPLAVTLAGTVGTFAAAPETRILLLFIFLPAALLCWMLSFFSPFGQEGKRFLPLWGGASVLLLVVDLYLTIRVAGLDYVGDFFLSKRNDRLWGFFVLLAMLLVSVLFCFVSLPRCDPVKTGEVKKSGNKKKNGKARAGKKSADNSFSVKLFLVPLLLFYFCVVLCCVVAWEKDDKMIPYPLLSALSALFVMLAAFFDHRDSYSTGNLC